MKLDGIDISYVVRQIPCTSKGDSRIIQSCTYAMSFRLAFPIKGYFPLQKIMEVEYVEGGNTNYENKPDEVKEFLRRADTHITLIRKQNLW